MNRKALSLAGIALSAGLLWTASVRAEGQDWSGFNGDVMAQKYSTATQITPDNVGKLGVAWSLHTGDVSYGDKGVAKTAWSATPLFVNNTVYVSTPFYRVFAVAPDTGKVKWIYDTHSTLKALTQSPRTRGLAYWAAANPVKGQPCQKVLYIGIMEGKLHALDADTGQLCQAFGDHGILNVSAWSTINTKYALSLLQPPTVYKDQLFIGWTTKDWTAAAERPGTVYAADVRTGKLNWTFNTIPEDMRQKIGTANIWASMSVDPKANMVYLPVSSPEPNYYGGDRKEEMPYVTSVTALNADTGQPVWVRQLVHHDIWDYDTNSAPTLVDINKDGKTIPALVQSTKQGFLYVLNRLTGEPIYPMIEKPVPKSDVPGEVASPTQPFVPVPEPTVSNYFPGIFKLADIASFGECSKTFASVRYDGKFTPPSLKGSLSYPATAGGVEWGGGAVDPTSQTYVVNSSSIPQIYQLVPRAQYDADVKAAKPNPGSPEYGSPYAFRYSTFLNKWGMPCWNPPYGTLSSYDLKTGKLLWREPFGQVQKWGFYMPESWGSVTLGAPIITKSGLIFIGASMDARVRAVDLKTGKVLWKHQVEAPVVAMPASYTYNGRQYIVFAAGGNGIVAPRLGDQLIAFALPN